MDSVPLVADWELSVAEVEMIQNEKQNLMKKTLMMMMI